MRKLKADRRGSLTLMIVLVVSVVIGIVAYGLVWTNSLARGRVYGKLNSLEGFYTNEFALWEGYQRFLENLDAALPTDDRGRFGARIEKNYKNLRAAGNVAYSPGAPAGTPYSVNVTRMFDGLPPGAAEPVISTELHQRLTPGNLFYRVQ